MWSLKTKIAAGLVLVVAYGLLAIGVALSLPGSNVVFATDGDQLVASLPGHRTVTVSAFSDGQRDVPATARLVVEEPDVLPDYAALNTLFATHQWLAASLAQGTLQLRDTQGALHPLTPQPRHLTALPGLFWLQLVCGLAGMMICLLVWVPAQRDIALHSFALTGLSYVLFSSAAAIYSTRDLFIPGQLFMWLSGLNHVGALLFSASLGAFLWNYPRRAPASAWTFAFYAAFAVAIVIDQGQWVATPVAGFHLWVMGIFLLGLLGAAWQGWQTRGHASHRAALRWVVLSIVAGTTFFAGGMILPAILQVALPASQGLLFTTFLLMYAGMALGVVRHRLFDLERWWFSLWAWLLGGLLVMLTDLLLAMLLSLSGPITLTLSMALVGWFYFPVRQYVWGKLFLRNQPGLETWLSRALPAMLTAQQAQQDQSGVEQALSAVFRPLVQERLPVRAARCSVQDNGESLHVPDPVGPQTYLLRHAHEGERLFTRHDVEIASLVLSLHELVSQTRTARAEGASEERSRIRRDIHDDLGAKLLHLLHHCADDTKPLVREAIRDLRDLLRNMEGHSLSLEAAASQWHEETARRCADHTVTLQWQEDLAPTMLTASQFSEMTRILREAVSNALKHSATTTLNVTLHCDGEQVSLQVENDGLPASSECGPSRGLDIMTTRAMKLGGHCTHGAIEAGWRVQMQIPLLTQGGT
ncbi:sensor histidine kinase [Isoalcanivorax pacificus W11-5]|uniref:histidine kinase n=1 Tax=Isoalcanivorax pacificus W11-5 TaxID=391936 RepID=A0A0B4XJI3_9GAMM|nr:sensor histidine kinase [Isoalcanivorax pacificus]AJD46850.1 sensor histidine kinase [Isoalcanivorax pacificus W11-5]